MNDIDYKSGILYNIILLIIAISGILFAICGTSKIIFIIYFFISAFFIFLENKVTKFFALIFRKLERKK